MWGPTEGLESLEGGKEGWENKKGKGLSGYCK